MLLSAFAVDAGQTAEDAYLPELSPDPRTVTRLAAQGISTLHVFEIAFTAVIFGLNASLGLTGIAGVRAACICGAVWMAIFATWSLKKMAPRAAAQTLPPGTGVLTAGYVVLRKSVRGIWVDYPMALRLLVGHMFLSAAVGAVISLATVFMVSFLEVSFTWVGIVFGLAMVGGLPGAVLATWLARHMSLKRVTIATCVFWASTFWVSPWVLTPEDSKTRTMLLVLFSLLWGMGLGMVFTAPKAFFVTIVPGGREAEFMGIQKLFGKSLSWLPPLIYTLINESTGGNMQLAMFSLNFFFLAAAASFATVDYQKAVAQVKPTLLSRAYSAASDKNKIKVHPEDDRKMVAGTCTLAADDDNG